MDRSSSRLVGLASWWGTLAAALPVIIMAAGLIACLCLSHDQVGLAIALFLCCVAQAFWVWLINSTIAVSIELMADIKNDLETIKANTHLAGVSSAALVQQSQGTHSPAP